MTEPVLKLPLKLLARESIEDADGVKIAEAWATTNSMAAARASQIIHRLNAFESMREALLAALILCNTIGREQCQIAYDGRNDFSVTDKLREALALAEKGAL